MDPKMQKFMKNYYLQTPEQQGNEMNVPAALIAEMVLEKSLHDFRKEQIKKAIDLSLEQRNKADFLRLVKELKDIS